MNAGGGLPGCSIIHRILVLVHRASECSLQNVLGSC
jgi:hypothetical protein